MATEAPETILIFAANPLDQAPLSLDKEVREIENGLRHSRKHFEVKQRWATRPKDLRRALLDIRPAYVHFCGHGAGDNGIVLEGQLVKGEALAELFGLFPNIKCVVLNACYSTVQAQAIARKVDFVVGMNTEIGDSAAIEFASAFYDALGAGESVEFAFALGRNAIQVAGIPEHLTPELLTRSGLISRPTPTSVSRHEAPVCRDWDGAPAVSLLYGREAVAELLKSWILEDFCRVVLITGMGGIGKTDLAACLGRGGNRSMNTSTTLAAGIQGQFDCVLWRSLLNAPVAEELLADILGVLSAHDRPINSSPNQQLEEILTCLQERRCLVILDNVESVLRPGDPTMRYRDGYEGYGELFELVAKTNHQSCLLLTSREKPRAIANLEGAKRPVRSLSLTGIGTTESQNLFGQISTFSGNDLHWDEIVKLYGGNPLALELVARHIDQVFDGDLAAFLSSGRHLFTDLEDLLDWHVDRLPPAETELIYWLAIEREPVTLTTLYDDLIHPLSRERIASTLQSLQRRIPLEHVPPHQFALQPVLIEHLTARLVNRVASAFSAGIQRSKTDADDLSRLQSMLNSHSLCKATAKESVRAAQQRLILGPIAEQLTLSAGNRNLRSLLMGFLDRWRRENWNEPGYAAGNIINLLTHLNIDLHGADFSHLRVWQASLHDVKLHSTDFSFADFHHTSFRHAFGTAFSLAYSSDGEFIAVGDDNGEIRLFFAKNGQLHMRCAGHADVISAIAFSADGQVMGSASFDNTIRLWNMKDGQCTSVLLGHDGWVYSLDFSPDGRTLASASEDGTWRLWDIETGACARVVTEEPGFVAAVTFSPDGQLLAVGGSSGTVNLFRTSDLDHKTRLLGHTGRIRSLAFSRQGDLLASGAEDRDILLWRPEDGTLLATLSGHSGAVMSLSFSDIGDVLASGSDDHTVRLWSTGRRECVGQLYASASRIWSVDCSPTGRSVAAASEDSAVRIWDIDTCQHLATLRGYSNKTWSLTFCQESSRLVAGNEDSLVRVWDVRQAATTLELRGHESRIWAIARSGDGKYVASASDDLTVRIWDLQSGTCVHILRGHADWIRSVAFSPDSQLLASGGEDGKIIVWDVHTGGSRTIIEGHIPRVFSIAFCGDESYLAAGGADHDIHLFSPHDGARLGILRGHDGWLSTVIPFDRIMLGSCSEDGTARIWDLAQKACTREFVVGHKVWCGAFCAPWGSFLTGSEDGTIRRWSLSSGFCEAEVRAHQGSVWSLAVNEPPGLIASAGDDGVIRLWQLPQLMPSTSPNVLRSPRPYEGMNITGATGLTLEQRNALAALGAIEIPSR
jgi:WD40 repeat protein